MSGGLRLHARYFKVAEATNTLRLTFLKIEERLDLDIERVIGILLQIATETNKAVKLKDRRYPMGLDEVGEEFFKELKKTEEEYQLTQGESLRLVLDAAANEVKYLIRYERHPNDPDKKGDEA